MVDPQRQELIHRGVIAAIRKAAKGPLPEHIELEHRFINDLYFDSMSVALLGLGLEDEFNQAILLTGWISRHTEPSSLTVASLCAYLGEILPADERSPVQP